MGEILGLVESLLEGCMSGCDKKLGERLCKVE